MSEVATLEGEIRSQINEPRLQRELCADPKIWVPLCSSLDVIGDIEIAIDEFLTLESIETIGRGYLFVYGLLQALIVQQDAVYNLCDALNVQYLRSAKLKDIRDIRVAAVGHPTKHKSAHSGFISRISLSASGFQLLVSNFDGTPGRFIDVDLRQFIEIQRAELSKILNDVTTVLRDRELEHKKTFSGEKLSSLFHPTIGYLLEKVFLASTNGPNLDLYIPAAATHLKMIEEMINNFRTALARRGLQYIAEDKIGDSLHAIARLTTYLEGAGNFDHRDAYIFSSFLEKRITELREAAMEIDRDYAEAT